MSKQDRQGARTVAALEQRYNFGKSFAEVQGFADDARRAADEATKAAANAHSEVIKLADSITLSVTGGEPGSKASIVLKVGEDEYSGEIDLQGLVTFESLENEGETVINGSNITTGEIDANRIKTGKIQSKDGKIGIDLSGSKAEFFGGLITNGLVVKGSQSDDVSLLSIDSLEGPNGNPYLNMVIKSAIGSMLARIIETFRADTNEHYGSQLDLFSPDGKFKVTVSANNSAASIMLGNQSSARSVATINEAGETSLNADKILGRKASWVYLSSIGKTVLVAE